MTLGLSWSVAFAAYAILGVGDAASALVGVAYGRTKLPWNARKSVEGTCAGGVAGFLGGVVLGAAPILFAGALVPPVFLAIVLVGAVAGALAETIPRVEDNFVVPLASAAVMFVLARAAGLELRNRGFPVSLYADLPHATRHGWPAWVTGADIAPSVGPACREGALWCVPRTPRSSSSAVAPPVSPSVGC